MIKVYVVATAYNDNCFNFETHRKNIMHKLHINSPAALMKFIITNNL